MRASSVDQVILETLAKEHAHLTSQQVYEGIRNRLPAVNRSTVYRALERLAQAGKISVSDMGSGASVYEKVTDGLHHHLVCQQCDRVITIDHKSVGEFFTQIEREFSFRISTNHLILFGICAGCSPSTQTD